MTLAYSHSYMDPETGHQVDVLAPEDYVEYRNATIRDHRPVHHTGTFGGFVPPRYPSHPTGGIVPPMARPVPAHPYSVPPVRPVPVPVRPAPAQPAPSEGHITISKHMIADIIPMAGAVWAAFLGRPDLPAATGDNATDHENATLHRDALAAHAQNQERIRVLTNLAGRALNLIMTRRP